MIGTFNSKQACIDELRNQCFKFSHIDNGNMLFTKESTMDIVEIHVYKDGSASALVGKYTKVNKQ